MIMDYNRVLAYLPVKEFMEKFRQYNFKTEDHTLELRKDEVVINYEKVGSTVELYTYSNAEEVTNYLGSLGIRYTNFHEEKMSLEDAFIGLTGKY
jgi:ABC-2 type transport system ATP-binding protein